MLRTLLIVATLAAQQGCITEDPVITFDITASLDRGTSHVIARVERECGWLTSPDEHDCWEPVEGVELHARAHGGELVELVEVRPGEHEGDLPEVGAAYDVVVDGQTATFASPATFEAQLTWNSVLGRGAVTWDPAETEDERVSVYVPDAGLFGSGPSSATVWLDAGRHEIVVVRRKAPAVDEDLRTVGYLAFERSFEVVAH